MRGACKSCGKPVAQPHHNLCPECFRKAGGRASGPSDRGRLHREVVVDWAREIALALDSVRLTTAPLRKYFGKVRGIQAQLKATGDFEKARERIFELHSNAAYDKNRHVIAPLFEQFIVRNASLAERSPEDFNAFVRHFESVVAFFPRK